MEATMFIGWISDYLKPYATALKVAHPLMTAGHCRCEKEERPNRRQ